MIVTRTKTTKIDILGVSEKPLTQYGEGYRHARRSLRKKLNTCWLCHQKFDDGDDIYLLLTSKGNKVACAACAKDTYEKLGDENRWKGTG